MLLTCVFTPGTVRAGSVMIPFHKEVSVQGNLPTWYIDKFPLFPITYQSTALDDSAPITSVIHVFVRIHAATIWLTRPLSLSCGSVSCTPSSFPSFQLGPPSKRGPCLVSNCILSHHPPLTLSRWPFLRSDRETDLLRWESSSQTYWCTCILTSLPLVLWQWQR